MIRTQTGWRPRWARNKVRYMREAIEALTAARLYPVRHLTAACDAHGRWQLLVTTHSGRAQSSIEREGYTIHFNPHTSANSRIEAQRIQRFYTWLNEHGCRVRRIVSGTRQGPDLMLRLNDGSVAIVEVKSGKSAGQLRNLLAERYGYLLDKFTLFYASESRNCVWHLWRIDKSGPVAVKPEALNG